MVAKGIAAGCATVCSGGADDDSERVISGLAVPVVVAGTSHDDGDVDDDWVVPVVCGREGCALDGTTTGVCVTSIPVPVGMAHAIVAVTARGAVSAIAESPTPSDNTFDEAVTTVLAVATVVLTATTCSSATCADADPARVSV